jgi:hypothetical protein
MWAFGITWRPSFVFYHLLTFHILIFSSETHQPNELKLSRKHEGRSSLKIAHFVMIHYPGLTKPGEVGNFFALVSMKSPNFCQKAKF